VGGSINKKQYNQSEMNTLDRQYSSCGGGGDDQEGVNFVGMEEMEYFETHHNTGGIDDTPYTDKKQLQVINEATIASSSKKSKRPTVLIKNPSQNLKQPSSSQSPNKQQRTALQVKRQDLSL
jgi:hypothetical protein